MPARGGRASLTHFRHRRAEPVKSNRLGQMPDEACRAAPGNVFGHPVAVFVLRGKKPHKPMFMRLLKWCLSLIPLEPSFKDRLVLPRLVLSDDSSKIL
jgi:hypothetical protein